MSTYIVSGLPRTGTSCMMRALEFAGIEPFEDGRFPPSDKNPHGFYEHTEIYSGGEFSIPVGMAAKVPPSKIIRLPPDRDYVFVFTTRPYEGMAASQRAAFGKAISRFHAGEVMRMARRNAGRMPNSTVYEFDIASGEMPRIDGLDHGIMTAAFEKGLLRWF